MERVAAAAVVDTAGVVTGWSEGARLLTGYPAEEAVGRAAADLVAEPLPPGAVGARTASVVLRHRDGHPVTVTLTVCPVQGASGPGGADGGYVITVTPPAAGRTPADRAFEQASVALSVFDTRQRYLRANGVACRARGVPEEDLLGRSFADTVEDAPHSRGVLRRLREVTEIGRPVHYRSVTGEPSGNREHAWDIEMWPVRDDAGDVDAVALAAFDSTEQHRARRRLALLNDAAAALGTTLDVARTCEELIGLLVPEYADFASIDLFDWVLGPDEPPPVPAGDVVLRRIAHGSATAGTPEAALRLGDTDVYPSDSPPARALHTGRAVLGRADDPGFLRWIAERDARDPVGRPHRRGLHSVIAVPLRARGATLGVAVGVRLGDPGGYGDDDALFAEELADRAAVCVDNARRFARERVTALALQHSLLPRGLPGQAAVEVAHRYLPSGSSAGIGGDWFDVIPLSGSRVALVVGDVVGHGIPSSATMGRLCMAVRTLADVDLPPDELLTHLDDLVTHLAAYDGGEETAEVGATCLYAVYDPVDRRLCLASAGHPAPVLLLPDGTARVVQTTPGPPLGVGGLPFEATELRIPEGTVVALYTDGLIEDRGRDIDSATAQLCAALAAPAASLDARCDNVLKAVLPEEPGDDVALLLAASRALGADQVATWDVPSDPAAVATARQAAVDQLAAWGLAETAFVTELVVSELVTNAIRYGAPPVRLRLIRGSTLICEVFDGSSTSPHLRRAHAFDEGGRGLLLVAQLTRRWGSRQTGGGKTIWAEQQLEDEPG